MYVTKPLPFQSNILSPLLHPFPLIVELSFAELPLLEMKCDPGFRNEKWNLDKNPTTSKSNRFLL